MTSEWSEEPPLSIVMPVYEEAGVIEAVVAEVRRALLDPVPGAELVLVDDRGADGSGELLARIATEDDRTRLIVNPHNLGHGPSIRAGLDATTSRWILLLDSDDQLDVGDVARLWDRREGADLVQGVRVDREDPTHRLVFSAAANLIVALLAGERVPDANAGCKLISRSLYEHLRPAIPADTFAPSLLLALGAVRAGARVETAPIGHQARPSGPSSLHPRRLAGVALRSTRETVAFRRRPIAPYRSEAAG